MCMLPLVSVAQIRFQKAGMSSWAGGIGGRHGNLLRMEGNTSCNADSIFPMSIRFSKGGKFDVNSRNTEWNVFYEKSTGVCKVTVVVQSFEKEAGPGNPPESYPVFPREGKVILKFKSGRKIRKRTMDIMEQARLSFP